MKIFGKNISITEKFKGFFDSGPTSKTKTTKFWPGYKSWSARCQYYERIYNQHPLAKSQILTIAGQVTADGLYLQPSMEEDPHRDRAADAVQQCEDLNKHVGMAPLIYDTCIYMAKYGSAFWEKTDEPEFNVRLAPAQEYIEPLTIDDEGNVSQWRQRVPGKPVVEWAPDEILHFCWNRSTLSWPYGTSLFVGLDSEFEIMEQLEADVKEYMHKNAFPKELWQIGDKDFQPTSAEIATIRSKVKNWEPGESFVTSFPSAYNPGGTGDREVRSLDKILAFLKEQCIDGLMTSPVSYQYSSTYASSKEMAQLQRANLIIPMQRIIAYVLESELYKPYLEGLGYSVKLVPTVMFEPPDAHFLEEAQAYTQLVSSGILTPEKAAAELGYTEEEILEMQQQRLQHQKEQMDMLKQKMDFTQQQKEKEAEGEPEPTEGNAEPNTPRPEG